MVTKSIREEAVHAPLRKAIDTNKKLIEKIKQKMNKPEKEEKKKAVTKIKKLYPTSTYSKVGLLLGAIIIFGSMWASIVVPDVLGVIIAFIESLDPLKHLKGGNALDPSHFVMFIK